MKINGSEYRTTRLSTFQQFDIARRLAPVLTMLALQKDPNKLETSFPQAFCGLTQGMEKPDIDIILSTCLSNVSRIVSGGAVPIYSGGLLAYDDIDLSTMLKLIWIVLVENNLLSFFSGALSDLTETPGNEAGSSGSGSRAVRAG